MSLQLDIDLGVKAQGPQGERGQQGEAGKMYNAYVTENGDLHAKLINPDGTDATA